MDSLCYCIVGGVIDQEKISQHSDLSDKVIISRKGILLLVISSYLPVVAVRVVVILLPQMVRGLVVLGVVVVVPPHPLHPLLSRAGQDRLSKHRHLCDW